MLFTELDPTTGDAVVKEQDSTGSVERCRFYEIRDAIDHAGQIARIENKTDELDIPKAFLKSSGRPKFMGG